MQVPAPSHCCSACFRIGVGVAHCVLSARPSSPSTWCSSYSSVPRLRRATGVFRILGTPCYGIRYKASTSARSQWVHSRLSASRRLYCTGSMDSGGAGSYIRSGHSGGSTLRCPHCAAGASSTSCECKKLPAPQVRFSLSKYRITKQEHSLRDVSTLWLLPIVTLIVASSGGGELVQALSALTTTGALTVLASATCTLSVGLALASAILVLYLCRLVTHGFPQGSTGVLSACVPLGPMGQSGVAALLLGEGARTLLPVAGSRSLFLGSALAGQCVYAVSVCAALALWALATLWLGYALLSIQHNVRRTGAPPFELAYWGLIFPNVCALFFS